MSKDFWRAEWLVLGGPVAGLGSYRDGEWQLLHCAHCGDKVSAPSAHEAHRFIYLHSLPHHDND